MDTKPREKVFDTPSGSIPIKQPPIIKLCSVRVISQSSYAELVAHMISVSVKIFFLKQLNFRGQWLYFPKIFHDYQYFRVRTNFTIHLL